MDRTAELRAAAERVLATASLPPEHARQLREALMLRRSDAVKRSSFAVAAKGVEDSTRALWDSIRSMQRDYAVAGALTSPDPAKDANEAQVASVVGRIGGYIDRLKQAATQAQALPASAPGHVNAHTAAHMHGVVLILAERLHRATMAFDRLRAARYQALVDRRGPGVPAPVASSSSSAGQAGRRSQQRSGASDGDAAASGRGPVAGAGAAALAAARTGWQHIVGLQVADVKGHDSQAAAAAATAGGTKAKGAPSQGWPVQVQEVEQENKALLERLTATRNAAVSIEQSVRDVAALNQMFSTAVLTQAETIESIYMAAVEATHNIKAGNESLTKTVAINRSTSRYILILLLVATLCLLFFDWFNS